MALTAIADAVPYPSLVWMPGGVASGVLTINAANNEAAQVFIAPKTGNINTLHFCTGAVTTGATVTVALKAVDASGDPAAVIASESLVIANADDNKHLQVILDPVAAVAAGTPYALCVINPAIGFGNMRINSYLGIAGLATRAFPYADLLVGVWAKQTRMMAAAVGYDDATLYNIGSGLFVNGVATDTNSGSSPDEVGNRFQVPVPCKASGIYFEPSAFAAGADYVLTLYDSDGLTPLAQITLDGDHRASAASGLVLVEFPAVTLLANTTYRVAVRATTVNNVSYMLYSVEVNADLSVAAGGVQCYHTGRTWNPGPGAWTDTATQRILIGVMLSTFDNGVSAGGGFPVLGGSVVQ